MISSAWKAQSKPGDELEWTDTLELAFETKSLRSICEREAHARCHLGSEVAEVLKHRLADFRAATSVMDLPAGRPRLVGGSGHERMIIDLRAGYRIVLEANHPNNPTTEDGGIEWRRVSRIKILQIGGNDG